MAFKGFRIFFLIMVLACVGLFFFKLNLIEISIFCQKREEVTVLTSATYTRNFLHLPDIDCRRTPPFLVLLVTSAPGQLEARMAIRQTWGKHRLVAGKRIVTYFLLGITTKESDLIEIIFESQKYRDIIQKDFMDSYYNLTLKTMMGIEWVHKFCSQSRFVMKTDTDMFVNIFYLSELLLRKNRRTRFFTGFLKRNERPIRDRGSKWYVSKAEYPASTYPPFCSGTGYVLSTDVVSQIYNISESVSFIKLEDVFIGLCLAKLKINPEELHSEQTFFSDEVRFSICRFKKIVTSHHVKPHQLLIYWVLLEKSKDEECPDV
ncbi:beta-1,3-galactosyltransferase 5-like [Pelodiscus sinensis]|uniref:Hexosyltransferase n=1 Tax=Pelodiscus sinensis TaxID=13735 RepID=K7F1D3_PELSI|nr:beta-1,3-galactosyltransferase 5-like [Pelodiscus sinensis]XP_014428766.1 beta-1,3-galactosyltransferase 5-like [Pelodiscus sinensis]XP_014428767.1 beta-1,3-galactosyltransferase 5-like [Pelodiscus sinensis]XP_014428768.1 beta-1,3-galactosyltransferase 5-like [Pelodiscus sinensis]|eukprot:XP_014428765.1 beta-1,3-galactosyltransferase 5-like [Pelodiscus sinensis]